MVQEILTGSSPPANADSKDDDLARFKVTILAYETVCSSYIRIKVHINPKFLKRKTKWQ